MASRPIFLPNKENPPYVTEKFLEFEWYPGFALSQAQKSIDSLHNAAKKENFHRVLEISSKSRSPQGVELSAFNLTLTLDNETMSVESAFQGSKVFEQGGPYIDLYAKASKEAKQDQRLRNSGELIGFNLLGEDFPTEPLTAFYDWLYIQALKQNNQLSNKLLSYEGFTDIAFNRSKSINCQARAAAQFVGLTQAGLITLAYQGKGAYLSIIENSGKSSKPNQLSFL